MTPPRRRMLPSVSVLLAVGVLASPMRPVVAQDAARTAAAVSDDATATRAADTDQPSVRRLDGYAVGDPVEPARLTAAARQRPNIVLITTDDQTTADLVTMPYTRRLLGDRGVTLEGISPHPLCCPARAEILTGQFAQNNGVRTNKGGYGGYGALDPRRTLATDLHRAGYETIFMGKFLNGYASDDQAQTMPGWTSWNPTLDGVYDYDDFVAADDGVAVEFVDTYQTDYFTAQAEQKIAEVAPSERPFFLWQSYMAPHTASRDEQETVNWSPPPAAPRHHDQPVPASHALQDPSYGEADVRDKPAHIGRLSWTEADDDLMATLSAARIRSLQAVDEGVRATVAALRRSGELDDTLIIFTSDNGFMLGEHRFSGKIMPYEPSLAVPFLLRGPGIPAGVVRNRIGATIDLAPTIVAAAGARSQLTMDGRNLLPVIRRNSGSWETLLIQAGPRGRAEQAYGWFFRGVRDDRYTYVEYTATGEVELYDRLEDPYQLDNVATNPRYAPVVAELQRRLLQLQDCSGAACRADFGPSPEPL